MTTVLDDNVHNLAVTGTFDDCQDIVKALFADPDINSTLNLGAVSFLPREACLCAGPCPTDDVCR